MFLSVIGKRQERRVVPGMLYHQKNESLVGLMCLGIVSQSIREYDTCVQSDSKSCMEFVIILHTVRILLVHLNQVKRA